MKWTNENPKQEGWYWYRLGLNYYAVVAHVVGEPSALRVLSPVRNGAIYDFNGQWSDQPIPEPTQPLLKHEK